MILEIDIQKVKEKAKLLVKDEEKFNFVFDNELCYDLIENVDDYLAEGLAAHFLEYDGW